MRIIAVDPSGNHATDKEGSGTTGLAFFDEDDKRRVWLDEIKSKDHESPEEYWITIANTITEFEPHHIVVEGYRLYNHAGSGASTQSNSKMLTSQLIGFLRGDLYLQGHLIHFQYASEVKTRWSDKVLVAKGYLEEGNKHRGKGTNNHKRDALRHLAHFEKYKLKR